MTSIISIDPKTISVSELTALRDLVESWPEDSHLRDFLEALIDTLGRKEKADLVVLA